MERSSWNEYFINITKAVATRSTCLRRQVGAIFVKDKRILATGYNGVPSGIEHCETVGCLREQLHCKSGEGLEYCRSAHAEMNCLAQAAKHGIAIDGATLYCTHAPCFSCAKVLINSGIRKVYYLEAYADTKGLEILREVLVIIEHIS